MSNNNVDTTQPVPTKIKKRSNFQTMFAFAMICLVMAMPSEAHAAGAAPWENMVNSIIGFLTNGLSRAIGIVVIIGLGFAAWAGKLTWGLAGKVILGFVFIFGAAAIADLFIGSV